MESHMSQSALRIRLARPDDARAVGDLIRRMARRWILPDQTAAAGQALLARLGARALREKIVDGQRFHLGYLDDRLVGVSAMRDDHHLVQFFVSTQCQGRGFARKLWTRTMQDAIRRAGTRRFTLNATRCAVPVYRHMGFCATGPERPSPNGLMTTPMQLVLPAKAGKSA
jgi:GNAT superfamily N-acetyltransferase